MVLFDALIDDAAVFPPGNAPVQRAVDEHRIHRAAWYGDLIGPLVVPDTELAATARAAGDTPVRVSVVTTGGAGGLIALARRTQPNVEVVSVESALRDLDDLAGNAERVVAAAEELPPDVVVYVELPYAPGWVAAVEVVEAAGHRAKLRTGGLEPEDVPSAERLAEQLSVLVEADLPFKATAGLHHAWPGTTRTARGAPLPQHGFLTLLMAVDALVDGAEPPEAADLLRTTDRRRIAAAVAGWDTATGVRLRRRLRSFGCCGVTDPVEDLVALGLLRAGG